MKTQRHDRSERVEFGGVVVSHDIVVMGLPAEGLQKIAVGLDIRHAGLAPGNPDEPRTPEWIIEKLAEDFAGNGQTRALLIYQRPWRFLERQLQGAPTLPGTPAQLESLARNMLGWWHAFHQALLVMHREYDGRCLLINGDGPVDTGAVADLLADRFGCRLIPQQPQQNPAAKDGRESADSHETAWWQIVRSLAPRCLDLYVQLEASAELMGRTPEFPFARGETHAAQLMQLLSHQARIDRLLNGCGIGSHDAELQIEAALRTQRESKELLAARAQEISSLQRNLTLRQAEMCKLEEALKSQQAGNSHLLTGRELERELAAGRLEIDSLKKENELCLVQLHHVQEELRSYFKLNVQKDERLAEMQQRLDGLVKLDGEKEQQLAELQRRLELQSASPLRRIVRRILRPGKSRSGLNAAMHDEQVKKISASGLFDEKWYLQMYPDVAQSRLDPIKHYLKFGVSEGRNPSAHFDTQWYLDSYGDVAKAGVNPLLHYIDFGRNEGRHPVKPLTPKT